MSPWEGSVPGQTLPCSHPADQCPWPALFTPVACAGIYLASWEVPGVSAPTRAMRFEAVHRDGGSLTHVRGLLPTLKLCQHLQDPVLEETA